MGVRLPFLTRMLIRFNIVPRPLFDGYADGLKMRVIQTGVHYNIFDKLEKKWLSFEDMAKELNLDPRGTKILLETLTSAGYLKSFDGRFTNTKISSKWLTTASPHSLCHLIRFAREALGRFNHLESSLKTGKPIFSLYEDLSEHPEKWRDYVYGMKELAAFLSWLVVKMVKIPSDARSLLDLGGSHGAYSIAFCKKYSKLTATIFDLPDAVKFGKENVEKEGMADKVNFLSGDFLKDPIQGKYDMILIFNVIHTFSPETNQALLKKVVQIMNPNGLILIGDAFTTGNKKLEEMALLGSMTMYNETGGETYSTEQVKTWMSSFGLSKIKTINLPLPGAILLSGRA